MSALDTQVGGSHYKTSIQPIEYIHANRLPFIEGNVVKYITRWRDKGGIKDLEKIKHYVDLLIELEMRGKEAPSVVHSDAKTTTHCGESVQSGLLNSKA